MTVYEVGQHEDDELLSLITAVARRHAGAGQAAALDDPDADLSTAGLGSLGTVEFLLDLEASLGIEFPADRIDGETFRSLRSVAASVRAVSERQKG